MLSSLHILLSQRRETKTQMGRNTHKVVVIDTATHYWGKKKHKLEHWKQHWPREVFHLASEWALNYIKPKPKKKKENEKPELCKTILFGGFFVGADSSILQLPVCFIGNYEILFIGVMFRLTFQKMIPLRSTSTAGALLSPDWSSHLTITMLMACFLLRLDR